MKIEGNNKRIGIFLFYDRDGIVDDYIDYMLSDIRHNLEYLLVVCNGSPCTDGITKLNAVADEVLIRDNSGFDVAGYREGLFHIGFKKLQEYEEIILFNYTFFGSIYPFQETFEKMDRKDLDFWGLTKHHMVNPDPFGKIKYGYLPEHIQSHFLVLRRSLFMSNDYKEFIISMKNPQNYLDSICDYEAVFTKHFADKGYKWDVYVNTNRFEEYAYSPIMFELKTILEEDRCPIIKRRSFFTDYNDYLLNSCGESSVEAYDYLRNNINYDLNLIWDNILRLENLSEVSKVMQLTYINSAEDTYDGADTKNVSIVIWVKSVECLEFYKKFLKDVPVGVDINLFGKLDNISIVSQLVHGNINLYNEDINDEISFLKAVNAKSNIMKEYLICCVMDDKGDERPYSNKLSNIYKDWNCMIASEQYVANMILSFIENPRMGLGIPPLPTFGEYLPKFFDGWLGKYDDVNLYLNEIGVHPNIKKDVAPIFPYGGNFVVRKKIFIDALKIMMCRDVSDDVFMMALPETVRHLGYYTGTMYSNNYAEIDITNLDYMFREMNKAVFNKYGPSYFCVVNDRIEHDAVSEEYLAIQSPITEGMIKKQSVKQKTKSVLRYVMPYGLYKFCGKVYRKIRYKGQ